MLRDRAWIERHIPHRGSMCLLDGVAAWDATAIRCSARSHREADNPLRAHGRLGAACGIEYAAQAMAVHGALLAPELHVERRGGYLTSLRGIELHVARLDDIEDDLMATAERVTGDASTILYEFRLTAGARPLVAGRAAIVINPAAAGRGNWTRG
jgi:predicted hotdog family 3-hydroxylacyl-ACP dehydratase